MPRRDRSGPRGEGPLSGWGRGDCGGRSGRGSVGGALGGRGFGTGWGSGGRGWRHRVWATGRPGWMEWGTSEVDTDERHRLQREAHVLESELELIRARLERLEKRESE